MNPMLAINLCIEDDQLVEDGLKKRKRRTEEEKRGSEEGRGKYE
jgi:hypothetical protein